MADILRGYTYSRQASRYRDLNTGRFVARTRIANLLESHVGAAEQRMGNIVQGLAAGEIAPGPAQVMLRDEMRRLSLSNAALGKGGFDRLTPQDYGRVGRQLRDTYARTANLVRDVQAGTVTLPQAMNRIQGYAGEARQQFFVAEREAMQASGRRYEERRSLGAAEHCEDCVRYAQQGWQPLGTFPPPGSGSICGTHCRCSMERREVVEEVRERIAA